MNRYIASKAYIFRTFSQLFLATLVIALLSSSAAMSIPALNLRSNENFVILAGSAVTGIPLVSIRGNVGLSPAAGSYISGFDGSNVAGTLYVVDASGPAGSVIAASMLQTAKSDLTISYNDAAGRTPVPTGTYLNPGAGNIGGLVLTAGLYKFTSAASITGADVTLSGNATDVWIFQITSSLDVGSNIKVILSGGAKASNVFWQVGTSASLGTYSVFKGTILADQSVTLGTGATMEGRALAFSAAVTMASGVKMTKPNAATLAPAFSVNPIQLLFGNVANNTIKKDSVTVTNTGTANLVISNVASTNTLFTVTPITGTIASNGTKKFYITYSPLINGVNNAYIRFTHNAANLKDSISVSGSGVSPKATVNPSSLNFGKVRINESKMDSVTIRNTGTDYLIVNNATSSNPLFKVTPTTGSIAPGLTKIFYVTFAPLTAGLTNGKISFNHSAGIDLVNVTGTGFDSIPLISIKIARDLPLGTEIEISGIVTRTLGSYTRVQDNTGAITILQPSGEFFNEVGNSGIQMGDLIRIQGKISEQGSLKMISGTDLTNYQKISRLNELPIPVKVTLSEIAANGEKYESSLVTIENLTNMSGGDLNFKAATSYLTSDASDKTNAVMISIGKSADTYLDGLPFLGTSVTFVGVISQASQMDPTRGYQLTPILPTDLQSNVGIIESDNGSFTLSDNYPNPFNSSTSIQFNLINPDFVTLKVTDVLGNEVATLVSGFQSAGTHTVSFSPEGADLSLGSNVYFYRLVVGASASTKQMILVK